MNDFLDRCRVLEGPCDCRMCVLARVTEEMGGYDDPPDDYPPVDYAIEWADSLPTSAQGPNCQHVRALAAEVQRLREVVKGLETSEGFFNAVIMAAQAFVHARCKQHVLYTDGSWCAKCYDAYNAAEVALYDAVAKMEGS